MEILALDVGMKRTGIARASAEARLAEPLKTVETGRVLAELQKILAEHQVEAVVVGLPRNSDGQDTDQTRWVRQWTVANKSQIGVPLYWQDEFLTSELAEAKATLGGKNRSDNTDAVAACIILEDFLSSAKTDQILV